jgi:hypothetical protein
MTGAIIFSSGCDKNIHCGPAYKIVDFTTSYTIISPAKSNNYSIYYLTVVGTYSTPIFKINIKTTCNVYATCSNNYTYLETYAYKKYPQKSTLKIFVDAHNSTECSLNSGTEYYITLGITIMSFSGFLLIITLVYIMWSMCNSIMQKNRHVMYQTMLPPQYNDLYPRINVNTTSPLYEENA